MCVFKFAALNYADLKLYLSCMIKGVWWKGENVWDACYKVHISTWKGANCKVQTTSCMLQHAKELLTSCKLHGGVCFKVQSARCTVQDVCCNVLGKR